MQTNNFYQSAGWLKLKRQLMFERRTTDGYLLCEYCGKPIIKQYDCIGHHKIELNGNPEHDAPIALDPANIMLVHHQCHQLIHEKFGAGVCRKVWLVYGAPCSGKTTFVEHNKIPGDLIIDVDNIWQCISGDTRFVRPETLKPVMFNVKRELESAITMRLGSWRNAWVIGSYPSQLERDRVCAKLGAEPVFIDATKDECIERLVKAKDRQAFISQWKEYIDLWFEDFENYGAEPPLV